MALSRIGTLQLQQMTLGNALRVQTGIFDAQQQISSGQKAATFAELNGEVETLASLDNRLGKAEQFIKNNSQSHSRVESARASVTTIIDVVNTMKNLIGQARNGSIAGSLAFEQQIEAAFHAVADQLNINVDGRYLFSGTRTDTKPIDDDTLPSPLTLGEPDAGYYLGSTDNVTFRVADDLEIDFPARADHEAFQAFMTGLATARSAHIADDDDLLITAYNLMVEAEEGLIDLQAEIGTSQGVILDANERHSAQQVYWKGLREDTIKADIIGLSTQLAVDQATLQATFQAFARINSLRLSDFLS